MEVADAARARGLRAPRRESIIGIEGTCIISRGKWEPRPPCGDHGGDDCVDGGDGGDGGEAAGAAAVAFLGIRPSLESSSG
jgi:hypothetical protein